MELGDQISQAGLYPQQFIRCFSSVIMLKLCPLKLKGRITHGASHHVCSACQPRIMLKLSRLKPKGRIAKVDVGFENPPGKVQPPRNCLPHRYELALSPSKTPGKDEISHVIALHVKPKAVPISSVILGKNIGLQPCHHALVQLYDRESSTIIKSCPHSWCDSKVWPAWTRQHGPVFSATMLVRWGPV